MITKEQALQLRHRQIIYDNTNHRWYVNGKCKTWKKDPDKFQVPIKHGLYTFSYLNNWNNHLLRLEE